MPDRLILDETHSVKLTDVEAQLLASIGRPEIQTLVAHCQARLAAVSEYPDLAPNRAAFIADVLAEGRASGRLERKWSDINSCRLCGRSGEYRLPSKRHKNKKLYPIRGVSLAKRFVRIKGYPSLGCCDECFNAIEPRLVKALEGVQAEIPEHWEAAPHEWKRRDNMRCTKCEWQGHEGQMRMLPAVMQGRYPGGCPECDATNQWLGPRLIESVDGFTMVKRPEPVEWRAHPEIEGATQGWMGDVCIGHYVCKARGRGEGGPPAWHEYPATRANGETHKWHRSEEEARLWLDVALAKWEQR